MQDLKITLVQTNQFWEDKKANLSHFDAHLEQIDQPTDVIVLPEMFHTGFTMNAKPLAETMDGEGVTWLKNKANQKDAALVASLIIEENGNFFNRMLFVQPNGKIDAYDKRKLFGLAKEDQHYTSGKKNTVVSYKGWNILLQVCYDLRFPENARNKVVNGNYDYDAIIYVANWPEKRSLHWKVLLQARAIENQCYVVGLNRVGKDANDFTYSGDSCIISPLGEVEQYSSHEEILLNDMFEHEILKETREKLPFLKDRE
jgi:predicted amidohydrolase